MIYILIGLVIIILAYVEAVTRDIKFSNYSLIVICFFLFLLAGLRDKVGTDWAAYYTYYQETTDKVEIGYAFLNNSFSNLGLPYNSFLLFVNGISLTLMYFFLRKNSLFMVIAALVFFSDLYLYFNLSGIRQAIATSITCFSISYAIDRKFWKFSSLILLACCFHLSAIIFVIVYYLPKSKLTYSQILFFGLGFLMTLIFLNSIADLITLYTMKAADYYVNVQSKEGNLLSLFYVGIFRRLIILGVIAAFGRKMFQEENFQYFFNIYLFGFAIYLSTYMVSPDIGVRMSSYFTIFDIILVGNLIFYTEKMWARILLVTIFSSIAIYKLVGYMNTDFFDYHSIINIF